MCHIIYHGFQATLGHIVTKLCVKLTVLSLSVAEAWHEFRDAMSSDERDINSSSRIPRVKSLSLQQNPVIYRNVETTWSGSFLFEGDTTLWRESDIKV